MINYCVWITALFLYFLVALVAVYCGLLLVLHENLLFRFRTKIIKTVQKCKSNNKKTECGP